MASFALRVIRLALAGAGRLSPSIAGRMAFRLFSRTPGRRPKSAKERALLDASAGWMATAERITLRFEGGGAVAHHFRARPCGIFRGRVLVLHGWGSRAAYLSALSGGLVAAGFEVVVLDLPGHGDAPGRHLTMPMAVRAIDAAWQRFGGFDAFCGHSFGGAALAAATTGILPGIPAHRPQRLVTIGSPSEMTGLFRDFGRMLRLAPEVQGALEAHVVDIAGVGIEAFDAAQALSSVRVTMLVIHAEDDKEVSADHARRYGRAGPHVSLHWENGFGHRRIVSAEPVIDRIAAFLDATGDRAAA